MVRMDKKDIKIFEALALGLINADIEAGVAPAQIARKCHIYQSNLNKWLGGEQGMSSKSIEKILQAYGIGVGTVADVIVNFASVPGFLTNLAKIGKSRKSELKDKIVSETEFLASQTKE